MAFKFWKFQYRPPETVTAPVAAASAPAVTPAGSGSPSRASRLMRKLDEMQATSVYLQQVVLARSRGLGVDVDPAVQPEIARALEVVYGGAELPPFVSVEMYNHLLDAEMTALQIEMALTPDSPYEVNAFQAAAATQVTTFVESQLIETGEFRHQVPLLLRTLKGDAVIYAATRDELAKYPAAQYREAYDGPAMPIQARTLDLSEPLAAYLDGYLDDVARGYASAYQLAATVGHIELEMETIVSAYFMQPVEDVIRMIALFQQMKGLIHIPRLKAVVNGLTGIVLVRLMAEAAGVRFAIDRFTSLALTPLKMMTGTVGRALGTAQGIAMEVSRLQGALGNLQDTFTHPEGGLRGMSYSYDCGLPHHLEDPKPMKGLAGIDKAGRAVNQTFTQLQRAEQVPGQLFSEKTSQAFTSLATHLKWGLETCDDRSVLVDEAFKKTAARRLADQSQQLDVMCSTQALDSLTNLGQAITNVQQLGTVTPATGTTQQVEAVGRILASTDSGTGTQFLVQDGVVAAVPPDVPPVPVEVEPVLRRGGLDRLDPKGVLA